MVAMTNATLRAEVDDLMQSDLTPPRSKRGRKPTPQPEPESVRPNWEEFAPMVEAALAPIYRAIDASPPDIMTWQMFCGAWGKVFDRYQMPAHPLAEAGVASIMVAIPLAQAWPEFMRKKRAERERIKREQVEHERRE